MWISNLKAKYIKPIRTFFFLSSNTYSTVQITFGVSPTQDACARDSDTDWWLSQRPPLSCGSDPCLGPSLTNRSRPVHPCWREPSPQGGTLSAHRWSAPVVKAEKLYKPQSKSKRHNHHTDTHYYDTFPSRRMAAYICRPQPVQKVEETLTMSEKERQIFFFF